MELLDMAKEVAVPVYDEGRATFLGVARESSGFPMEFQSPFQEF